MSMVINRKEDWWSGPDTVDIKPDREMNQFVDQVALDEGRELLYRWLNEWMKQSDGTVIGTPDK